MADNKPSGRPQGRPQGSPQSKPAVSGSVHKRGDGLGTGKVGNADYNERKAGQENRRPESTGDRGSYGSSPLGNIGGLGGNNSSYNQNQSHNQQSGMSPLGGIGGLGGGLGSSGGSQNPYGGSPLGTGRPKRSGGGGLLRIILIIAIVLFLMNMLGMCGTSSSSSDQNSGIAVSTPVPTQNTNTNASAGQSTASVGHWNPPATTYEDASTSSVSTEVAGGAREKFTKILGNGNDQVTVLIYMCGTDLETNYGMATSDLNEMLYATHSDKVNIVVETGGTRRWKNSVMSNSTNQRWLIADRAVQALDKNVGKKAMTDPATLTDFIKWGSANFPANRYFLILWDHGGGSLSGYAHDELYPNGTMTVDEISKALKDSGVKFDAVGFDACLMANMETAIAVEPYADYLIASEETEPGTGWYYTNWVTNLSKNSSMPTTELGKQIVDDFITASYQASSRDKTSLSLVDLAEFSGTVPSIFSEFSKEMMSDIKSDNYRNVALARSNTKEFATSTKIDQIDLIHFCKNLGTASAAKLASSIQNCVKYNRCNNMNNAYGLSIYFPYYSPRNVNGAIQVYKNLGMDSDYTDAVRSFATLSASGQIAGSSSSNSLFDILGGGNSYSQQSYSYDPTDLLNLLLGGGTTTGGSSSGNNYYGNSYGSGSYGSGYGGSGLSLYDMLGGTQAVDDSSLDLFSMLIGRNHLDQKNLILTENDEGVPTLSLSQDDWDKISDISLNVWVDDGEGYIDLGIDDTYSFDDDGALRVEYAGTWIGINDQVVSYYKTGHEYISEDDWRYNGYVPVHYNGQRANILLEFNPENPEGEVLGVQLLYDDGITAKGFAELAEGDKIDFLCDYYDYAGNYQDTYFLGEQLVLSGSGLETTTIELEDVKAKYGYRLTDIYNSHSWTQMLDYEN